MSPHRPRSCEDRLETVQLGALLLEQLNQSLLLGDQRVNLPGLAVEEAGYRSLVPVSVLPYRRFGIRKSCLAPGAGQRQKSSECRRASLLPCESAKPS